MAIKGLMGGDGKVCDRFWRFGDGEFDEFSRELRVKGKTVELESKPLDVLHCLLLHAGEVVTKEELIEAVWPGVSVVEGSLATAVSKLRKALGDAQTDDAPSIVITIPRIGYRLGVPVQCKELPAPAQAELGFKPGDPVAGRDQWRLTRRLDTSAWSEVWLAEHPKTGESRVFKFASDGVRLKGLKREVTLARLLRESLGERPDFVRLLEWNFETPPYYLESEYSGPDLLEWAESRGGLGNVPLESRLQVLVEIAQAVAAAHELGVLHKDLKPANVLIATAPNGSCQVKVADFGSGGLLDPSRLGELGITNLGFTQTVSADSQSKTGTLMYMAPEVLAGQSPTASADVYAMGVLLYQLIVGDFRKPVAPGWEADIADPLLREDIAAAACGDPSKRLVSAAALAERLQTLERRRSERNDLELAKQRAQVAEGRVAAARARKPWVIAAVVTLLAGLGVSLELYRQAAEQRDRANHQTGIANAMNRFLASDLLGRSDPFRGGASAETLVDAVKQASPKIDRQFRDSPEIAARLHHTIAIALDNRSNYADARQEYERAAALFVHTQGPLSQDAAVVGLQRAAMEARTYQAGSVPVARTILEQEESRLGKIPQPRPELAVWLASARGIIALIGNNAKVAAEQFQAASDKAQAIASFDESARLTLKQRLAFSYVRLGEGAKAEELFRELIAAFTQTDGPDSANVLRVRLNLAQAYMIQGKNEDALRETSSLYPLYVARLGESHELTLQLLSTRGQCEGATGHWDDAIRDDLKVHDLAVGKQGPTSFFAIATLSDAALAQCRGGRYSEGEANARKAWEVSARAFGPRAGLTGGAADTLANCLIGTGKLAEASTLLRDIDTDAVAQLTGARDWSANVALAQGQIALRQGDYAAARKYWEMAKPVLSRADAEPFQKQALEELAAGLEKSGRK
jgi:DNA-binding winged helix-turn-helix (wHTH) protein/serine/threonine protein kinase